MADSYNLCGALEFAEKISKVGTQPIIGTQINLLLKEHLEKLHYILNQKLGYKNLTKLSSLSYLKNKNVAEPFIEIRDLKENNKDLIILTGNYNDFFGKLFYANKLKIFEKIKVNLRKHFLKGFILKFKDTKES